MAQFLNPWSGRQFLDANGNPYVGAQLFSYASSATGTGGSTKQTLTKDAAGASDHANPAILNARGEPGDGAGASQAMWQPSGVYVKLVLAPASDSDPPTTPISSWDNLGGINDTTVTIDQWVSGTTPTFVGATSFTLVGDQTSTYEVGRRIKTTNTAGTIYSTIITSAYTSLTTITVVNDSGVLDSGLSAVSYGLLTVTNPSITPDAIIPIAGPNVASATALPWPAYGEYSHVTGTNAITSFDTSSEVGTIFYREFDGILTITHHATNLICLGNANITTAAGDVGKFLEYASGDVKMLDYTIAADAPSIVSDVAYDATTWNANTDAATKNAIRDQLEIMGSQVLSVIKSADESVDTSTTLQNDDELTITLVANKTYRFESLILYTAASTTPDIKYQWTEADGTYWLNHMFSGNSAATANTLGGLNETSAVNTVALTNGQTNYSYFKGIILAGGAGGAFTLQWAQNVSDAAATTVNAGSYIRAVQLN